MRQDVLQFLLLVVLHCFVKQLRINLHEEFKRIIHHCVDRPMIIIVQTQYNQ